MTLSLYSIFDRVSGVYSEPFCSVNEAVAVRRFNYLMANSKMVAGDCELYCVGTFSTLNGAVEADIKPQFVIGSAANG
ncbi:nonstructural protein [Microvirus mar11]|uniref:Nonstructural protein n=1 Tax=Microvirus mar11 TaxID=2851143 RepID=A0A8F5XVE4_9VIRU|nr:nonstructural protein [Microvirus mar11]